MTTIATLQHQLRTSLQQAGFAAAALEASLLLRRVLGCSREHLIAHGEQQLSEEETTAIEVLLKRRLAYEPIAYILGEKEFYGRNFHVSPATLIPRPDSETMIEALHEYFNDDPPQNIIDFGTGSGCLLLSALLEFPSWSGAGVDISKEAIKVAKENAKRHNCLPRVSFLNKSWEDLPQMPCDIILANPPYISSAEMLTLEKDVREFEPITALEASGEGLDDYRSLAPVAKKLLKRGGYIFLEVGATQAKAVKDIMKKAGFKFVQNHEDLAGKERVVVMRR